MMIRNLAKNKTLPSGVAGRELLLGWNQGRLSKLEFRGAACLAPATAEESQHAEAAEKGGAWFRDNRGIKADVVDGRLAEVS